MSSTERAVPVTMLRIQWPGEKQPTKLTENVRVGMFKDPTNNISLRISVDQKTIITEELDQFEWLEESCTDGVATIRGLSINIVMLYDSKNSEIVNFFKEMESLRRRELRPTPPNAPLPQDNQSLEDQIELAIFDLVRGIQDGSDRDAVHAAKYLAQRRANVHFSLADADDNQDENIRKRKSKVRIASDILQLKLQIECHLNRDPLIETIFVQSGTTLRTLKGDIERQTGIDRRDQYWYAFNRYMINDDYEFGSSQPVISPCPRTSARKQISLPPTDPIRSGDTLIMYIAQMEPFQ